MSFITLTNRFLKRPTEKYYLQKKDTYVKEDNVIKDAVGNIVRKDAVGNTSETWSDVLELEGVIQHRQDAKIDFQGEESAVAYYGYFKPTFSLETDKLANYRVKFVRDYETLYLKITQYDANNYYRRYHHHIVLVMEEDLKYKGRQQ